MLAYNAANPEDVKRKSKLLRSYKNTAKYKEGMANRDFKGTNHPSYGKVRSQEWRDKIGAGNKGKNKGKTWDEMYGVDVANRRRKQNAEYMAGTNARLMCGRTSQLEHTVGAILIPNGFKQNVKVNRYTVDFLRNDTIVEVYGDYWHCNPLLYPADYYNKSIEMLAAEKWQCDNKRTNELISLGYNVIIIWESDLLNVQRMTIENLINDNDD
jgi:very-short-patch-repair endonuclease